MLVAFQGFTAPPGGKKTVAGMENVFVGEYKLTSRFRLLAARAALCYY
jgi:hypothetical protein